MPYRSGSVSNIGLLCAICELDISEIQNYMQCDKCGKNFHLKCLNILGKHINHFAGEPTWLCKKCKISPSTSEESNKRKPEDVLPHQTQTKKANCESLTNEDKLDKLFKLMEMRHDELKTLMKSMEESVTEVKVNQNFLSNQFDTLTAKLESISADQIKLKKDVNLIKNKQEETSLIISTLQSEVDNLKQKELAHNVIIGGLPNNVDPQLSVLNIMKVLQMNATADDISEAKILVNKSFASAVSNNHTHTTKSSILVTFKNIEHKHEIINKKKQKKSLFTYEAGINSSRDDQIYIRDHLTSYKMNLFKEAKELKQLLNIKYLWMSGTRILLRKQDSSKVFPINNTYDLEKVKKIFTAANTTDISSVS